MSAKISKPVSREVIAMCVDAAKLVGVKIGRYQRLADEAGDQATVAIFNRRVDDLKSDFIENAELIFAGFPESVNALLEQMDNHAENARKYDVDVVI